MSERSAEETGPEYAIENGWLVEVVNEHTCGTASDGYYGAHEPGCGLVPVARVADLLAARAEVPPGPCWHDPGMTWPTGVSPRCELRAGHAGAHECDRGSMGGCAVWTDDETQTAPPTPDAAA